MPEIAEFIDGDLLNATTQLLAEVDKYELTDAVKAELFANILLERLGSQQRRFSYSNSLEAEKPGCVAEYERTLEHRDWVNGEDVVDADEFNERWAQTQNDLDAAAKDAATALDCLAGLRAQLAAMFEEIRGEINTIHADIHALKGENEQPPFWSGPYYPPAGQPPIQIIPNLPWTNPNWGVTDPPPGMGVGHQIEDWVMNPNLVFGRVFGAGGRGGGVYPVFGSNVTPLTQPGSPHAAMGSIGGMPATRLTDAVFNNEEVEVWSTPIGTLLTPVTKVEDMKAGYIDPRLEIAGLFNAWVIENDDTITRKFGGREFRADELEKAFGDQTIGQGIRVADAIKNFSSSTRFGSTKELAMRFIEEQAASVRDSGASIAAKMGTIGVVTGDATADKAAIDGFTVLTEDARKVLKQKGINTVGKFQATPPKEVQEILSGGQIEANLGAIAGWQGVAGAVIKLG